MTAIEITGKTLDEAKKLAAEKLGVAVDQVDFTVLEEAKGKGLFGQSKVRIRAEAATVAVAVAAEPSKKDQENAKEAYLSEGPAPVETMEPEAKPKPRASKAKEPKEAKPAKEPAKRTSKAKADEEPAKVEAAESDAEPAEAREEVVATEADAERLVGLLREFLEAGNLAVTAKSTQVAGRYVTIELDGKDVAFLVGKHGEVLNALQYLMNIVAGRKFNNGVRATLDGNDYRRRREDALTKLATNIANEVKSRGEEAVLDALPAFERRIVHKALSEFGGIVTYSEGEEPNRRVVIAPAD